MPFIGTAIFEDLALMIENDALDLGLDVETLGYASEAIDNGLERVCADGGWLRLAGILRLKNRRRFLDPGFLTGSAFFDRVDFISRHLQSQIELGLKRGRVVRG